MKLSNEQVIEYRRIVQAESHERDLSIPGYLIEQSLVHGGVAELVDTLANQYEQTGNVDWLDLSEIARTVEWRVAV